METFQMLAEAQKVAWAEAPRPTTGAEDLNL